jgi:hypothetical protein
MRRFLHAWWPVTAVVAFTAVLVVQIPRKALFFHPVAADKTETFVSFVSLDDDAYSRLVSRIRMTWQIRGRSAAAIADSRTDAFDFSSLLPPPTYLPLREVSSPSDPQPPSLPVQALKPPTLGLETPPVPTAAALPDRDPDLLAISDDFPGVGSHYDFTIKNTRSTK